MANKKTADNKNTVSDQIVTKASSENAIDTSVPVYFETETKVPSELWHCVEDTTNFGTLAFNLPSGCLIMVIIDQNKPAVQYVPGIHYDETNKRFSV